MSASPPSGGTVVSATSEAGSAPTGGSPAGRRWLTPRHRDILVTASSLAGTTAVTSLLGFVYWGVAARLFTPDAVGYASAAVSAMSLLGTVGIFGMGTLLIAHLPSVPGRRRALFGAALWVSAILSGILGVAFGIVTWLTAPDFARYAVGIGPLLAFTAGVALTGAGIVFDNGLVGLLRGGIQLWRNVAFSVIKLGLLLAVAPVLRDKSGVGPMVAWVAGLLASFLIVIPALGHRSVFSSLRPRLAEVRGFGRSALDHHWLNLAAYAPRLGMPLIVTGMLSARANASFYAAWLLVTVAYIAPTHLSMGLFAVSSNEREGLQDKTRLTLVASLAVGVVAVLVLVPFAHPLLSLFGGSYADATKLLQILAWGYFPNAVRAVGIVVQRVQGEERRATGLLTIGGVLEVVAAVAGIQLDGLTGLAGLLIVAYVVEALLMVRPVMRVANLGVPSLLRRR